MTNTDETRHIARWADSDEIGYAEVIGWAGGWVLEDEHSEWVADLDTLTGYLAPIRAAVRAVLGWQDVELTPIGANVTGPTNPAELSTCSGEWTVRS